MRRMKITKRKRSQNKIGGAEAREALKVATDAGKTSAKWKAAEETGQLGRLAREVLASVTEAGGPVYGSRGALHDLRRALSAGATLEQVLTDEGSNALQNAAFYGNVPMCEYLLAVGDGDYINAAREDGRTALLLAAMNGHLEAVALLLSRGAAVDATDKKGATPMNLAAQEGYREVVSLLLSYTVTSDGRRQAVTDAATSLHISQAELEKAGEEAFTAMNDDDSEWSDRLKYVKTYWTNGQINYEKFVEMMMSS